jgi:nucleoside-diphosphate kinase
MEYTLSIIKPDAMERSLAKEINAIFTNQGLKVVAQKEMHLTKEEASQFYAEHKARPFYNDLVDYISSGPVLVQVLAGNDAIKKNRDIMGATNPKDAAQGTIRALYAESIDRNSVHGSDSPQSAKREISFFFNYDEITDSNL